jgi:hypothetical protein
MESNIQEKQINEQNKSIIKFKIIDDYQHKSQDNNKYLLSKQFQTLDNRPNNSSRKLYEFKQMLRNKNYFEDDSEINIIYQSSK